MKLKKIIDHVRWRIGYHRDILKPQKELRKHLPNTVQTGPFSGMQYINDSTGSVILPKIIGTYENELHEIINTLKERNYVQFLDIGAAEGYYAVGIAKYVLTDIQEILAFEATARGREKIKKLAALNDVSSIEIHGTCDVKSLNDISNKGKTFILMDIEGGEYGLLCPSKFDFTHCDILVEIHESTDENAAQALKTRMALTHKIKEIAPKVKSLPAEVHFHQKIVENSAFVVDEFRGGATSWLFLEHK